MRKDITIAAAPRSSRGKNEARRLRVSGQVPAILYGTGKDAVAIAVDPKPVAKLLFSSAGHNTIFNLDVQSVENTPVMMVDYMVDPIKGNLLHVDFQRIDLEKRLSVNVPVHLTGEARGVKLQGGLMEVIGREIEIECLPDDIPEKFTMDVTELMIGGSIRASAVPLTGSMKLTSPADAVIVHIIELHAEAAPAEAEVVPAVAEPEVIKKGKKEEETAADKDKKEKKK
jgi:large subunit ribosomal protein L25